MNQENAPVQTPPVPPAPAMPTPGIGMAPNYPPMPEPTPAPTPEPAPAPTPEPAPQPTPPADGTTPIQNEPTPAVPTETKPQLTYDEYLDSLTQKIPKPAEFPKPTEIDQNDPEALVKFFEEYGRVTVERAQAAMQEQQVVQTAEARAWKEVFTKYPEIENNPQLRDTIHNIRMGAYHQGQSHSPLQVADALVGTLHAEYKRGVNDTNVQTRIQDSQPLNGGSNPQPAPAVNYEALQQPGQAGIDAAVQQLEAMIRAGKV